MKNQNKDNILERALVELQSRYGLEIETDTVRRSGFAGHEELIQITMFVLAGAAGALVKSLGDDIWKLIKLASTRLLHKDEAGKTSKVVVEIRVKNDDGPVSYLLTVESIDDLARVGAFNDALLQEIQKWQAGTNNHTLPGKYRLLDSGIWVKN